MRIRVQLAWLSFVWLALFAPDAPAATSAQPIRIGVSLGLTGNYAELGRMCQLAYQLWETKVNQRGGILGRPVQMIIRDDRSDLELAKKIYEDFIVKDKVDFVLGPYSSQITAAVAPITEKHRYAMLAPSAGSDELWTLGYKYLFGVVTPASRRAIGFLALLAEAGIKRVAVIGVDDAFSVTSAEGIKRWASEYGLTVVSYSILPKKNPDLAGAARTAQKSGAQALALAGHFDESVAMRRVLKEIEWSPAAYYATVGPSLPKFRELLGTDVQGVFTTSLWEAREDLKLPGSAEFLSDFRARFKDTPSYQAANSYAACQVLEEAIRKVGALNRDAIREVLATMDIGTITGRHSVDRTGLQVKQFPLIVQWQGDKREIIWPEEVRTAKPRFKK